MSICPNKWKSVKIDLDLEVAIPESKLSDPVKKMVEHLELAVTFRVSEAIISPADPEVGVFEEYCEEYAGVIEIHNVDGDLVSDFLIDSDSIDYDVVVEAIHTHIGRM